MRQYITGFNVPDGGTSTPTMAFSAEPTTGLSRPSTGAIAFNILGAERMRLNTIGLGIGAVAAFPLFIVGTDTSTNAYSIVGLVGTRTSSSTVSNTSYFLNNSATISGSGAFTDVIVGYNNLNYSNTSTSSVVRALTGRVAISGTGAALNISGVTSSYSSTTSGTVTNYYGYTVGDLSGASTFSNTGVITNTYGLYIGTLVAGTQTNTPYGIYQTDTLARNYLGSRLGIGTNAPNASYQLHLSSSTGDIQLTESSGTTARIRFKTSAISGTLPYIGANGISLEYNINDTSGQHQLKIGSSTMLQIANTGTIALTELRLTPATLATAGTQEVPTILKMDVNRWTGTVSSQVNLELRARSVDTANNKWAFYLGENTGSDYGLCVRKDQVVQLGKAGSAVITGTAAYNVYAKGKIDIELEDNTSGAFILRDPSSADAVYMRCDTTTGSKTVRIGNDDAAISVQIQGNLEVQSGNYASFWFNVVPKTSNYTIVENSNTCFTNEGAAGTVQFSLPGGVRGMHYTFIVASNQTLAIRANGSDVIKWEGNATGAGGSISNNSVTSSITLICTGTNTWIASSVIGTWT